MKKEHHPMKPRKFKICLSLKCLTQNVSNTNRGNTKTL